MLRASQLSFNGESRGAFGGRFCLRRVSLRRQSQPLGVKQVLRANYLSLGCALFLSSTVGAALSLDAPAKWSSPRILARPPALTRYAPGQGMSVKTDLLPAFYSIPELAHRWRCSRGTVYNRLRFAGAKVLDFATSGKKGKKLIPALTVLQIDSKYLKALV